MKQELTTYKEYVISKSRGLQRLFSSFRVVEVLRDTHKPNPVLKRTVVLRGNISECVDYLTATDKSFFG
jgi:hypothetical protein